MGLKKWLKNYLAEKIFSEEDDVEEDEAEVDEVEWSYDPYEDEEMSSYIENQVEAMKKLHFDTHSKIPTQPEIAEMQMMAVFAFQEVQSLKDGIDYMVDQICPEEEPPEWATRLVHIALMEYIAGNLRTMQNFFPADEEEEESGTED